jgi:hypothetical protein
VFVDDSNLVLGARGRPFNIGKVVQSIHKSRAVKEKVVVGSGAHRADHFRRWEEAGYLVSIDERRGKEVFVDEALMSQIGKAVSRVYTPARILALVTGDGNRNHGRASFPEHIDTALLHGWGVELYSWKDSMSSVYGQYAKAYDGRFKVIFLDDLLLNQL